MGHKFCCSDPIEYLGPQLFFSSPSAKDCPLKIKSIKRQYQVYSSCHFFILINQIRFFARDKNSTPLQKEIRQEFMDLWTFVLLFVGTGL